MITWMRDAAGIFQRLDGIPEDARAREVFIEVLDPGARQWRDDYRARFPRGKAIELVEHAIARKQVRFSGYRLVPAPAKPISEATRARLAALHARQENDMAKKGKKAKKAPKAPTVKLSRFQRITLCDLVKERTELVAKFKGNELKATLDTDGVLTFAGKQFDSLSMAAKAATDGASINGWTFWKLPNGEPIDTLRKKSAA